MKKDAPKPSGKKIDGIYEGLPYVGPPLNLKTDDPSYMLPRKEHEITVRIYMMNNPADVKEYEKVMHEVGRGWAQISHEDIKWIERHETWKVLLRVLHHKYIEPEDMSRAQKS